MKFTKPALSVDAQLTLLQQRGMVIADVGEARHTLHHINYYRLRAYWLPFELNADGMGDAGVAARAHQPASVLEDKADTFAGNHAT